MTGIAIFVLTYAALEIVVFPLFADSKGENTEAEGPAPTNVVELASARSQPTTSQSPALKNAA